MTGKVIRLNGDQTVDVQITDGVIITCDVSRYERLVRSVYTVHVRIGSTVIIDVSPYNDRQGRIVSEVKA